MKRRGNVLSPIDSVNTLVEMLVQTDSSVEDGEIVWVRSVQSLFVYRLNSGLVANGTTVIGSLYGGGVWVLLGAGPTTIAQRTWYFDSVNGSDSNGGTGPSDALRTPGAMTARIGASPFWAGGAYHLYFLNDSQADASGVLYLAGFRSRDAVIFVHGSATPGQGQNGLVSGNPFVPVAGTITAVTPLSRSGSQNSWQIASGSLPVSWTASGLIGKRIRWTGGISATSWAMIDLGTKVAEIAQVVTASTFAVGYNPPLTNQTPVNGQTFVVERLTQLPAVVISLEVTDDYSVNTGGYGLIFDSVEVGTVAFTQNLSINTTESISFDGCVVLMSPSAVAATFVGCKSCRFTECSWDGAVEGEIYGGYAFTGCAIVFNCASMLLDGDFQVRAAGPVEIHSGYTDMRAFAVFNAPGTCGIRYRSGRMHFRHSGVSTPTMIWGSGNAGVGVGVSAGCVGLVDATGTPQLTITGVSGDFSLDSATTSFPFNTGTRVYDPAVACTWANYASGALGGTPFKVIDPRTASGFSVGGALS